MGKQNERDYLKRIGEEGIRHAENKPFADDFCGEYLIDFGAAMLWMPPPPAKILDLGCGSGWTSRFLARRGYEVLGVDISEDMVRLARRCAGDAAHPNLHFDVEDYEALSHHEAFDVALFFDSLHHAEDEGMALSAAYRALKPGGLCIAVEPGKGHAGSPPSREAIERYGVTEKDMPPARVSRMGRRAGFWDIRTFPHARHVVKLVHGGKLERSARTRRFGGLWRWFAARWAVLAGLSAFHGRFEGTVVMRK
ncbi:MAG: class I SAM-dependent methyltransferase [Planctomycetota bacterium]|jgi:SAM-dependent methyltransferase